jgi:hypothetical protein
VGGGLPIHLTCAKAKARHPSHDRPAGRPTRHETQTRASGRACIERRDSPYEEPRAAEVHAGQDETCSRAHHGGAGSCLPPCPALVAWSCFYGTAGAPAAGRIAQGQPRPRGWVQPHGGRREPALAGLGSMAFDMAPCAAHGGRRAAGPRVPRDGVAVPFTQPASRQPHACSPPLSRPLFALVWARRSYRPACCRARVTTPKFINMINN